MQVQSIAESSKKAFCNTLTCIKLLSVLKTFVLSIFEWPLKTGFTVFAMKLKVEILIFNIGSVSVLFHSFNDTIKFVTIAKFITCFTK